MTVNPKKLILPVLALALLAALFFVLAHKPVAPDVTFTTLEGKKISMQDLRGKVVLVNFWATDCSGCIMEMPKLVKTYQQYHARGFELVAVAMPYDSPSQVLNYSKKNALPFMVMHDGLSEVSTRFDEVSLTPTSFLIDQQGHIIRKVIGDLDFAALHQVLDKELSNQQLPVKQLSAIQLKASS